MRVKVTIEVSLEKQCKVTVLTDDTLYKSNPIVTPSYENVVKLGQVWNDRIVSKQIIPHDCGNVLTLVYKLGIGDLIEGLLEVL